MPHAERILEDLQLIRMLFQRLQVSGGKVDLGFQEQRASYAVLQQETDAFLLRMEPQEAKAWGLATGEKISLNLEDRGLKYEAVTSYLGGRAVESLEFAAFAWPRTLRRSDSFRHTEFVPDKPTRATFTNARNALLEGHIKGFGDNGVELALDDPKAKVQDFMRLGEESTLDVTLEQNLRLVAPAKVAYFGEALVGLQFTERTDAVLLEKYQDWLKGQVRQQQERDLEAYDKAQKKGQSGSVTLPPVRVCADRDPMIFLITEREDFARHMSEAFGRKYGFLCLDYITGPVRYHLKEYGGDNPNWGRVKLILVHNQLRLASPLELTRQLVEKEKCPVPILLIGTEEDAELKRNRAIGAGAVDYYPVEPFRILAILRKLDEVMSLFG